MDQKIVDANIAVHTAMASTYASSEPHFRPENQKKVRAKLERLPVNEFVSGIVKN